MNENNIKGHLGWLTAALATHRHALAGLLSRLKDFGAHLAIAPALHLKFLSLLGQIARHRAKEIDILNEIEDVEKRHRALRQGKMLRRATSLPLSERELAYRHRLKSIAQDSVGMPDDGAIGLAPPPPKRFGLWKMLLLFYLLSPSVRNQKRQDFTVN